jgi:hypothetical protein
MKRCGRLLPVTLEEAAAIFPGRNPEVVDLNLARISSRYRVEGSAAPRNSASLAGQCRKGLRVDSEPPALPSGAIFRHHHDIG